MGLQVGVVSGLLSLKEEWSTQLTLAAGSLGTFSEVATATFAVAAASAGLVAAAFTAVGAAALELGNRGADVNDVAATLDHFAGSAGNAAAIMAQLRSGTLQTVDDFTLAKDAAHLLSAGVQLTAEEFGTLGSAAFILQNRGLGGTKEMLDLVSDAMVTGRTRALAMALGVVDVGDAEAKYAASVGLTKDLLSDTEKVEAKRIAILGLLSSAVKDAGAQERDFGEQIEAARTFVTNWVDAIGKAVATSPVLAAGMKAAGDAVLAAFGGSQQESIDLVVGLINKTAIAATYFAQGAVEAARVVHVAFALVETVVLGVETAFMVVAAGIAFMIATVAGIAATVPGATQGMKDFAASSKDAAANLHAQADSLDAETQAAAQGIIGHSAFDHTLDHLSGTIATVRDAMTGAAAADTAMGDSAKHNADQIMALQKAVADHAAKLAGDQDKLWAIEKKSLEETAALWTAYFTKRTELTGSSFDAQRAKIDQTFADEVAKLDASDKNYTLHYQALEALAKQATDAVGDGWSTVADTSIRALGEIARHEGELYSKMLVDGGFFRADMDAQRLKWEEARDAARGFGDTSAATFAHMRDDVDRTSFTFRDWLANQATDAQKTALGFDAMGHAVAGTGTAATLSHAQMQTMLNAAGSGAAALAEKLRVVVDEFGDITTAAERINHLMGGSFDVTTANVGDVAKGQHLDAGALIALLHQGYSAQQAIEILQAQINGGLQPVFSSPGPRVPGFATGVDDFAGGWATVGEHGPETMYVPSHASIFPSGSGAGGGSSTVNLEMKVSGLLDARTIRELTAGVKQHIMAGLQLQGWRPPLAVR